MESNMSCWRNSPQVIVSNEKVEIESKTSYLKRGFRDGIPIALGYIAVSFTFGIAAKNTGLTVFQAVMMSITNVHQQDNLHH
jgi:hypothetical protein